MLLAAVAPCSSGSACAAPPPTAARGKPLRVFLFDSRFCEYRGVLCLVQVLDGALLPGAQLQSASSGKVAHTGHLPQMGIASS